jgi:hypothetical protein
VLAAGRLGMQAPQGTSNVAEMLARLVPGWQARLEERRRINV